MSAALIIAVASASSGAVASSAQTTNARGNTASPTITTQGQFHVTVRGSDGAVYDDHYTLGDGYSGFQSLGGKVSGSPATSAFQTQFHVTAASPSGTVYDDKYDPSSSKYSGFQSIGGTISGSPVTTVYNNQFHITVLSPGGDVYENYYDPATGKYAGFHDLGAPPGGATGTPAVAVYNKSFHVTVAGKDGAVYDDSYTPSGGYGGFHSLGGSIVGSPRTTVYQNQFHVTVISPGGNVYDDHYDPSAGKYSGFQNLGAPSGGAAAGIPAATVYSDQFHVTVTGKDGAVYDDRYTAKSGYGGFHSLGGSVTGSPVTTVYEEQFHVTALSPAGNVYDDNYNPSSGKYSGFQNLGAPPGGATGTPAVAVYSAVGPQPTVKWGWDTEYESISQNIYNSVATNGDGAADFLALYLGNKDSSKNSVDPGIQFTSESVATAHSKKIALIPIERQFENGSSVGASKGNSVGQTTVTDAKSWGIPANTTIFIDIEPPPHGAVDEAFIRAWYDTVKSGGYTPGFYGSDISAFNTDFCAAVQDEPSIATNAFLWSFDPSDETAAKPGPDNFTNNLVTCPDDKVQVSGSRTVLWQYDEEVSNGAPTSSGFTYDEDEARGSFPLWFP